MTQAATAERRTAERRGGTGFAVALSLAVLFCLIGLALTVWQVQRLSWKTDLIARIEARVNAPPAELPAQAEWASLAPEDYEYRRVRLSGTWRPEGEALSYALTELGAGYWVMTPLETVDGGTVYVNRGFVPMDRRGDPPPAEGPGEVTGLMRVPETGGLLLRGNDPAAGRWYSRDVAEMAAAAGLSAAPFFVDAEAGALPVGGLTRVSFPNHHLQYALTFLVLAAMAAGAAVYLVRQRLRPAGEGSGE